MSDGTVDIKHHEAEVERLRGERDIEYQRAEAYKDEVERLADMAAFYAKGMDKQNAEVVRLRAELANKHGGDGSVLHVTRESQDALYADRDRARAEVERLRQEAENADVRWDFEHAEVERQRDWNNALTKSEAEKMAENERLRAALAPLYEYVANGKKLTNRQLDNARNALAEGQ